MGGGAKSTLMAQPLKVMTYNIRYDNPNDGINNWEHRKNAIVELIAHYQPSIFGIQEGLFHQVSYLDSALRDYNYFGIGRDGNQKGEYSAIFFNKKKLKVIEQSTFWLSETSDKVSRGWDAALPRICTFGLFEDLKTGQRFWVFNTHFDHKGIKARNNSAALILEKIKEINTETLPIVLMGDFNSTPESTAIKTLSKALTEASSVSQTPISGPKGTFNGFDKDSPLTDRIDYIFVKGLIVLSVAHIEDRKKDGYWISDHLPVMAELRY